MTSLAVCSLLTLAKMFLLSETLKFNYFSTTGSFSWTFHVPEDSTVKYDNLLLQQSAVSKFKMIVLNATVLKTLGLNMYN